MSSFTFDQRPTADNIAIRSPRRITAISYRVCLAAACAFAAIGAIGATGTGDLLTLQKADAEMAYLLRGMALIKAALIAPVIAVLWWRLGHSISTAFAGSYIAAAALLCGATGLIWQLTFIGEAAIAFHAAGFALMVLAIKDSNKSAASALLRRRGRG